MVKKSLLNRLDALEARQAEDPELLAEKTNAALDQMIRTLPGNPDDPDPDFEKAKQRILYGHHKPEVTT